MEIPDSVRIFDHTGEPKTAAWVEQRFGNVIVRRANAGNQDVYRIVEIREKIGPAALIARVLNSDGAPLAKIPVIRFWPGAPELPQWDPPPERYYNNGVVGKTNSEGDVGFGMGQGDYYVPTKQQGASALWVAPPGAHTDLILGLGMLPNTNHAHLDTTFQLVKGGDPDDDDDDHDDDDDDHDDDDDQPPVPGTFWDQVGSAVQDIGAALAAIGHHLRTLS